MSKDVPPNLIEFLILTGELIVKTGDVIGCLDGDLLAAIERGAVTPLNVRIERSLFGRHYELIREWVCLAGISGDCQQNTAQANSNLLPHASCVATDAALAQCPQCVGSQIAAKPHSWVES